MRATNAASARSNECVSDFFGACVSIRPTKHIPAPLTNLCRPLWPCARTMVCTGPPFRSSLQQTCPFCSQNRAARRRWWRSLRSCCPSEGRPPPAERPGSAACGLDGLGHWIRGLIRSLNCPLRQDWKMTFTMPRRPVLQINHCISRRFSPSVARCILMTAAGAMHVLSFRSGRSNHDICRSRYHRKRPSTRSSVPSLLLWTCMS